MTDQDFPDGGARLEISPSNRYARAGARVDRDPTPGDPARAKVITGRGAASAPGDRAALTRAATATPSGGQPRQASGRFARYPLRRHGARIRAIGHAAYTAAVGDLRAEIAAAADYVRSAQATAERAGMHDPDCVAAIHAAIRAAMDAGDALTAAMHTWRPQP